MCTNRSMTTCATFSRPVPGVFVGRGPGTSPSPRTSAARQSHGQSQRTHLHKESHEHSTPPAMRRMGQQHTTRARCRASMSRHHPSTRATSPTIQNAPTCTPTARQPSLAPKSRLGVRQCAKRGQPRPRSSRCRSYDLASQPQAHTASGRVCAPKRKEHKPQKGKIQATRKMDT